MTRALRRPTLSLSLGLARSPSPVWSRLLTAVLSATLALGAPGKVSAAPTATAPADLGSLALPDGSGSLRVEADGGMWLGSARLASLVEPGQRPASAAITLLTEGAGAWRIEIRLRIGAGGRAALLRLRAGQPLELLFVEPFGPSADGELQRHVRIDAQGARRWQGTPAVARCDGAQPLFLEAYDMGLRRWLRMAAQVPAAATQAANAPLRLPPPRRALRFSSASSDGVSEQADRLGAPRELDDGRDESALQIGQGAKARGAFVTARAPRIVELVAIRVAPPPAPARLPEALVLIGGSPAHAVARLALNGASGAGWFSLSPQLRGSCVSLVVDEPAASTSAIGIGEVTLFAADDAPTGLGDLARQVGSEAADAEGAARSLEADPAGGAAALQALGTASPAGRLRLLAVLRVHQASLRAADAPALLRQLALAHGDERPVLVDLLAAFGEPILPELGRLLADATQTDGLKADLLTVLSRLAHGSATAQDLAFGALLDPSLRDAARRALVLVADREPSLGLLAARRLPLQEAAAPTLDARAPERAALVAVIGAAAAHADPATRAELLGALDRLGPLAPLPFELSVRVLAALSRLGGPSLHAAVGAVLRQSTDAAQRLVAVDALPAATDLAARLLYTSALADADARVRELALRRLAAAPGAISCEMLSARADDRWPQVRRLAYDGLGISCAMSPPVVALLDRRVFGTGRSGVDAAERDPGARAAALAALARAPSVSAEKIAAAIRPQQPDEVREQAALLLSRGGASILPLLTRALDQVFQRGGAELPGTAVALLRALGRVGSGRGEVPFDDATLVLLRDAAADPYYPTVRIAALEALSRACPSGAKVVFDRSDKDPEPAVQRASALGRGRCAR